MKTNMLTCCTPFVMIFCHFNYYLVEKVRGGGLLLKDEYYSIQLLKHNLCELPTSTWVGFPHTKGRDLLYSLAKFTGLSSTKTLFPGKA